MIKENLTRKIQSMEIGGCSRFSMTNEKYLIEFRLFEINKVEFLAVSGAGVSLLTFFKYNINDDIDYVMKEINNAVFKGIDLNIEESRFI